jgi:hypothetical protein
MAEKTKLEKWLASLTPEQRAAFDASVEFGDQEYMGEVQRKLPPETRFGGEFGLLSALGYGKGTNEDRAGIKQVYSPNGGLPLILGEYLSRDSSDSNKDFGQEIRGLAYMGGQPPVRGKDVSVFHPLAQSQAEAQYASPEGIFSSGDFNRYPETVAHELTHKGFDSPAFLDFLKETGRNKGKSYSPNQQHYFIGASENENVEYDDTLKLERDKDKGDFKNLRGKQEGYRVVLNEFKKWLTPEKQKKYGIRLPVPAAEPVDPSMLDKLMNFIQGK